MQEAEKFNSSFEQVTLKNQDVVITTAALDGDARLVVEDMGSNIAVTLKDDLGNDMNVIKNYNIKVIGKDVRGNVQLTLPIGESYEGKNVVVKHLCDDGTIDTFNATVKDGVVTVELKSLSPVLVAMKKETPKKVSEDKKDKPAVKTQKAKGKKVAAKTGDYARTGLLGIMTILGGIGAGLSLKKKKED